MPPARRESSAQPPAPQISDAEWEVMKVLWGARAATAAEVISHLAGQQPWAAKTVKTLLNRLVKKGALAFEVRGKHYVYRPKVTRDACVRSASRSFLARVFDGAAAPALAHFLRHARLSDQEIAELRRILDPEQKEGRP